MTQAVRDALADAETLRLMADAFDWPLRAAAYYGADAAGYACDRLPRLAAWKARRAATAAFRAVPGLRG